MNFNNKLLENWWDLLRHLSAEVRLELAARLINSLKTSEPAEGPGKKDWKKLYGAWANEERSAEELIDLIKDSRLSNRKIESFD